jgi:hypothetical protein
VFSSQADASKHIRAHNLAQDSREGLQSLGVTYASVRRYEFNRLLSNQRPPALRNVSAALARLTLITHDRPDLTVLSRYLEHDLFLHGAVLTIDVESVLELAGANRPDRQVQPAPHGDRSCNPAEAARDVIGTLHQYGRPAAFTGYCDIAADGTHAIELDGDLREIPPWARWPLRAACWLSATGTAKPRDPKRSRRSTHHLYGHLPPVSDNIANNLRNGLEPLTSSLQDAFTYEPFVKTTTSAVTDREDGFSTQVAEASWTLRKRRRTGDPVPRRGDPGVRWLFNNDLAYEDVENDGRPALHAWLLDAIRDDAFSRRPQFNENYRLRFSSGLSEPRAPEYASHFREPQRCFQSLTR